MLKQEKSPFHIEYMQKHDALFVCIYTSEDAHTYIYRNNDMDHEIVYYCLFFSFNSCQVFF